MESWVWTRSQEKVQGNDDLQTQKGSVWNEMCRMEAEKALVSVPGKVLVQVPCHIQNNLNIFRYFGRKMEKLGTVPAASWFKNNDQVLFRFSVYLSWFSGELGTWAPWFGKTYGERRNKKVVHRSQMGRPRIWQISLSHISSRTQNKSESLWHLKRSLAISSHIMFSFCSLLHKVLREAEPGAKVMQGSKLCW